MLPRSRTLSNVDIQQKKASCPGIWKPSGIMMSDSELRKKVVCINDRRGISRYYIKNDDTGGRDYIGQDKKWAYCVADPEKRALITCDISSAIDTTDSDYIKVANYITTLASHGEVEPFIIDFIEDLLIYTDVSTDNILEILKGAFVLLHGDQGMFYDIYNSNKYMYATKKAKTSSHYSIVKQARMGKGTLISMGDDVRENNFFELIMGKNIILDDKSWNPEIADTYHKLSAMRKKAFLSQHQTDQHTWFQFEASRGSLPNCGNVLANISAKPCMLNVGHIESTGKYLLTGRTQNIGPFGKSRYTESNPLVIKLCEDPVKSRGWLRLRPCDLE
tara:strand:+ start:448 stop:1446 length:999 start_codon:yes stop_codon:yes gene_type:complete